MKQIEVITGCMFAGKTTELINRLRSIKQKYLLVKPLIDKREEGDKVSTHSGIVEKAIRVNHLSDIFNMLKDIKVVGVDEAQFFKKSIVKDLKYLKSKDIRIILAGLDRDYLNKPFGSMSDILSISDTVTVLKARCNNCQAPASYSFRKNTSQENQLLIGNENFYEALCEVCFNEKQIHGK